MKRIRPLLRLMIAAAAIIFTALTVNASSHPTVYNGKDYSLVYNYDYFVKKYPTIAKKYNYDDEAILRYFVTAGMNLQRRGCASFDVKSYRYGNADLRRKYGTSYRKYYLHFINYGHKSKTKTMTATGITAMRNAITVFEGVDYSEVYDYAYFLKKNPSVITITGDDDLAVLTYFVTTGMKKKMVAKDTSKYPKAKPGSTVYQKLYRKTLYPTGSTLPKNYVTDTPKTWNEILLSVIAGVKNGGEYYTGGTTSAHPVTTERAMVNAFTMGSSRPTIDLSKARPSYCSSACYMVLLKTLLTWDTGSQISKKAWTYLRPYAVSGMSYAAQADGVGCWGRANANGPGLAILVKELGAGKNYHIAAKTSYSSEAAYWKAWANAEPGDFLKIFRDKYIGARERGHMVVYLGHKYALNDAGERDDIIYYWSSQSSTDGYGITSCRASQIYRGVLTKITAPEAFNNAKNISPTNKNSWLASFASGHNSTVKELLSHLS